MKSVNRFGRLILPTLAATSALLWLLIIFFWFHSHGTQTVFERSRHGRLLRLYMKENGAIFEIVHGWPADEALRYRSAPVGEPGMGLPVMFDGSKWQFAEPLPGVSASWGPGSAMNWNQFRAAAVPTPVTGGSLVVIWLWPLGISTLQFFTINGRLLQLRLRQRRRLAENRCLSCGYDLRASPDRCPECGSEPKAAVQNR